MSLRYSFRHRFSWFLAFSAMLLTALPARGGSDVTPADQLQFQQKTVETQMQELQERMYRLADLTRDTEPDNASRLLMAVRKAREDLILEQMRDVLDQLNLSDYARAADGQAQVLAKLEELKKLLTSTDLDMQLQLERLKALNAAIVKLDAAIAEEQRQHDQSAKFAQQELKSGKLDAKTLAGPQQEQKQNRQATETIAQTVKDLSTGAAKAGETLGTAAQSMSLAEGRLGAAAPSDAQGLQGRAVDDMKRARDQLDQERQKILDELQSQVRKQVVENLTEMLERQKSVRGATEAIVVRNTTPGRAPDDTTLPRLRQLGSAEAAIVRICDETSDLVQQTEFSVALPPALQQLHTQCAAVQDQLTDGSADAALVADQKQIESDLQDLLDTFKQLDTEPGPPSNCRGCKGNKNKLLAELKVIRMMQLRVDERTTRADAERGMSSELSPALSEKITSIRDSQQGVQTATDAIHKELSGGN